LYWKGTRRFPFQTNPFLVFHPAAELQGIPLINTPQTYFPWIFDILLFALNVGITICRIKPGMTNFNYFVAGLIKVL